MGTVDKRLQLLLEHLSGVIWTTDGDLRFTSSRGAGLAELGLEEDQVVGMPLTEFFQTQDPAFEPLAAHRRALEGEVVNYEAHWNGRVYDSHTEPLRDSGGEIVGTVGIALDITDLRRDQVERERLLVRERAALRRFTELMHGLDAIVWESDPAQERFQFVSRPAEEILGYPVERWLDEPGFWAEHIHPEDRERVVSFCRNAAARGEDHEVEYRMLSADGRDVWLRDLVRPVLDTGGRVVQLRGVMVDITRSRKAGEEIEALNRRLEARQAELATYHDMVTHDLSNFSMTLQGLVDRLLASCVEPGKEQEHELLLKAKRQAVQLVRLAENAKLLARLREKGIPVEREPVDIGENLDRALEMVTSVHFDRTLDIEVRCPEDLKVRGLPFLENILINLLDNAVRYTPLDSEPVVRVSVEDRSDSEERGICLQVRGGRPVDEAFLSRVFERYVRGAGSKGLGLGLALVREIVEAAGGRVEAANADEGGRKVFEARISLPPE